MLDWPFRDADSFHPPANVEKMRRGIPLEDADRWPWLAAIEQWIDERLASGKSAIVSCSALKRSYRQKIIGSRVGVRLVYLKGSKALIGDRLQRRKRHFMPASLLSSQFDALQEPHRSEKAIVVPISLSPRRVTEMIITELGLSTLTSSGVSSPNGGLGD
jgi:carbohydrate kinase (thermoresistant glucokinase family)